VDFQCQTRARQRTWAELNVIGPHEKKKELAASCCRSLHYAKQEEFVPPCYKIGGVGERTKAHGLVHVTCGLRMKNVHRLYTTGRWLDCWLSSIYPIFTLIIRFQANTDDITFVFDI